MDQNRNSRKVLQGVVASAAMTAALVAMIEAQVAMIRDRMVAS